MFLILLLGNLLNVTKMFESNEKFKHFDWFLVLIVIKILESVYSLEFILEQVSFCTLIEHFFTHSPKQGHHILLFAFHKYLCFYWYRIMIEKDFSKILFLSFWSKNKCLQCQKDLTGGINFSPLIIYRFWLAPKDELEWIFNINFEEEAFFRNHLQDSCML
jgi:hypothetical protein